MSPSRSNIVVVGGGLAGMAAAIEALYQTKESARVTVTLLEKERRTGGNSAKASSGINGAVTQVQKRLGIKDSVEAFVRDTIESGRGRSSETLVKRMINESTDAVSWLRNGFLLELDTVSQLGGHSFPRTHRIPDRNGKPRPVGWEIASTLGNYLSEQAGQTGSRFRLITEARVTEFLTAGNGRISGLIYETAKPGSSSIQRHSHESDVVVLATGGFGGEGSQPKLLKKYAPDLVGLPATNGPFATGNGVLMASAVGAALVDMDQIQVHPTGFVKADDPSNPTKFLAAESLRGAGGILLNGLGKRFVNELDTRDSVTSAMAESCSSESTRAQYRIHGSTDRGAVKTQAAADSFGHGALGFYQKMGLMHSASGLDGLASAIRADLETLRQTLLSYDRAKDLKTKDDFGKTVFPQRMLNPDKPGDSYFWGVVTPSIHYTMGGVRFDQMSRVLRESDGQPIPGLLAAGEVTGGLHGANRLAGNSLLECVVYGRRAGQYAAAEVSDQHSEKPLHRLPE
ncbi:hypothetical protein LPJ72_000267 [Coemansia sp. Benny D160-2]|nr:hypothetical protein LPJ72_000267 [Coemansia sp. Benny D160-2]